MNYDNIDFMNDKILENTLLLGYKNDEESNIFITIVR